MVVVAKIKGAIFSDQSVNRPHAGDVVAPAGRATGDRHHPDPGILKPLNGAVSGGRQPPGHGQGVVDIGEHIADAALGLFRKPFKRFHGAPCLLEMLF